MHHISKITIKNYKSIIDAEFSLSVYTPLVGYNNAGKTNILKALNWVIKKNTIPKTDYYDPTQPVIVEAEISGITDEVLNSIDDKHRKRIEPIIIEGRLCIRRIQEIPDSSSKDIRLEILITNDSGGVDWEANPTGIDAAISYLFPEPLFVGAMENATEDVGKFGTSTTIGKLIKEIIGPISEEQSEDVKTALADVGAKLSADGTQKSDKLIEIDNKIQTELTKLFPGISAKIHIPTPEFSDFIKSATIKIFEQIHNTPVGRDASSLGHGTQRAVQIALIQCLAKIKQTTAGTTRTTLLLIDEPELYLHPQAIELVRSSLKKLTGESYQVIFTTHSANMIAQKDVANALLIRWDSTVGTKAYPRIKESVEYVIEDADTQAEILFELTNAAKILFSERIVLAEGKTERIILPKIYKHKFDKTLDADKMGLVALDSANNMRNAMKILQVMKIPVKAVVDLDFAFSKVAKKAGLIEETNTDIIACKAVLARLHSEDKIGIDESGLPRKRDNMSAAGAFELMAKEPDAKPYIQNLHASLLEKNFWLWKRGTIETQLGIEHKNPKEYNKFTENLGRADFTDSLPNYQDVKDMLDWLQLPPVDAE